MSTTSSALGPLQYAAERVLEVALGCAIGVAVTTVLAPARAYVLVLEAVAQATSLLADELDAFAAAVSALPPPLGDLPDRIRKALNRLETLTEEAARERNSRLSDEPDPEPLYRTLRRLRHDIVALSRVLAEPLPEAVHAHLAEPWRRIAHVTAENSSRARQGARLPQPAAEHHPRGRKHRWLQACDRPHARARVDARAVSR